MKDFLKPWEKNKFSEGSSTKKSSLSDKDEIEILKKQMSELKEELNKKK